ncbi:MAG: exodeoxyribonuclease V subunit alpha [Gemmatimonadota bacterium]|nr:exodeoxyribonuclease V subunit alpha [Gammaproteobacteria bacterium]MDE2983065.1 exodeoxyribonuclease V subunit alpha [Gemmatimonadota bacterium]
MSRAAVRMLQRRWGLPDAATPALDRFLIAWAAGHTSVELSEEEAGMLASSTAVTDGSDGTSPAPLVLRGTRLQSWRLDRAETRVAARLRALAREEVPVTRPPDAGEDLARLFPDPRAAQRRAAELGLRRALALVTGGSGTGKTTTAARLLALLAHRERGIRVALAAPTGKAAARMGEAIGEAANALDGPLAAVRPRLERAAGRARTLHRLLGWNPRTDRCRFHAGNPLPADLVVVDEASMLDLVLWDRALAALGRGTRLIVLGDHRQLESVQPGRVLRDMIVAADGGALDGCHVELDRNYRFESHPGISSLADAVRRYDGDTAVGILTGSEYRDEVAHYTSTELDDALDHVWPEVMEVVRAGEPEAALAALERVRILCALRRGRYGVEGINARVEARLRSEGLPAGEWAPGRPVLVTVNDPHSGLFNGDVGVLMNREDGRGITAWFPGPRAPRSVPLAALPSHDTAWAMTVHRSQGSEFGSVLLVLPPQAHELVGPELLYTGVTRARSKILIAADEAAVRAACRKRPPRRTGLLEKLMAPDDGTAP